MADLTLPVPSRPGPVAGRMGRFILERFPPVGHGTLVLALVLCGRASAALAAGLPLRIGWDLALAVVAVASAFLGLRALDEIRDAADDRLGRPDRPLPRGLVSVAELRTLAVVCSIAGAVIAAASGPPALVCFAALLAQIWVLGRASGHGAGRRRAGLAGALLHSGMVPTGLLFGWASGGPILWDRHLWAALLLVWGAGLALELGRKTVGPEEERDGIETYSAELGRSRALALTAAFLVAAALGAAVLSLGTGRPPGAIAVPLGVAAATMAAVLVVGGRIRTGLLRTVVPGIVLGLLSWPVLLSLARGSA